MMAEREVALDVGSPSPQLRRKGSWLTGGARRHPTPTPAPSPRGAVTKFMKELTINTVGMSERYIYRYAFLVEFIKTGGTYDVTDRLYRRIADRLVELADGQSVYLANGYVFTEDQLDEEFPEFAVFDRSPDDSFVAPHPGYPRIRVEKESFAKLRALHSMRRELRKKGLAIQTDAVELIRQLLTA